MTACSMLSSGRSCNEAGKQELESPISKAFEAGYDEVVRLETRTLALWCLKTYYGIRFKEHLLLKDQRHPDRGPIVRRSELREMSLLFLDFARNQNGYFYTRCCLGRFGFIDSRSRPSKTNSSRSRILLMSACFQSGSKTSGLLCYHVISDWSKTANSLNKRGAHFLRGGQEHRFVVRHLSKFMRTISELSSHRKRYGTFTAVGKEKARNHGLFLFPVVQMAAEPARALRS